MPIDKYASRIWRAKIRNVLNQEWDPIGVADSIDDEYNSYVGDIARLIRENATDDNLMRYLEWAESVHMGFGRFNQERGRKVVSAIRELGPAPEIQKGPP
jgi:hypothetical protein